MNQMIIVSPKGTRIGSLLLMVNPLKGPYVGMGGGQQEVEIKVQ